MTEIPDPAQQTLRLDFLSLFSANQRLLVAGLFRQAVAKRHVTRPISVTFDVSRELTRRTFHALGEKEGESYATSLRVLRDHGDEARAYAESVLKAAGKEARK